MIQNYFLFNQYQNKQLLKRIWRYSMTPKIEYLFAQTILDQDKTEGPVLVYGDLTKLKAEYNNNPADWLGLYIDSDTSPEQLLKHLRALLFVTYPPESKGVLTYYDTHTMHYFFNYTEPEVIATYLGPIQFLKWYGNTWLEQQNPRWHQITNQANRKEAITLQPFHTITKLQQQGLSLARQHKYIYDWSQKMLMPIAQTNEYFEQAIMLGFDRLDYLDQYMTLRANNPSKSIPENLQGDAGQKLNYLKSFWIG